MEDTLEKSGSKLSTSSSFGCSMEKSRSLRRSVSQPRIIIDFDTDLIHHRSYSEFEDDNNDESDEVKLVRRTKKGREKAPLLKQRHLMYDPALASCDQNCEKTCKAGSTEADSNAEMTCDAEENSDSFGDGGFSNAGFAAQPERCNIPSQANKSQTDQQPNVDVDVDVDIYVNAEADETNAHKVVCSNDDSQTNVENISGVRENGTQKTFVQEY